MPMRIWRVRNHCLSLINTDGVGPNTARLAYSAATPEENAFVVDSVALSERAILRLQFSWPLASANGKQVRLVQMYGIR